MFDPNDKEIEKLRQMHKQGRRTSTTISIGTSIGIGTGTVTVTSTSTSSSKPGAAVSPSILRSQSLSSGKGSADLTVTAPPRSRPKSVAELFRVNDELRATEQEAAVREAAEYTPFIAGSAQELGGT